MQTNILFTKEYCPFKKIKIEQTIKDSWMTIGFRLVWENILPFKSIALKCVSQHPKLPWDLEVLNLPPDLLEQRSYNTTYNLQTCLDRVFKNTNHLQRKLNTLEFHVLQDSCECTCMLFLIKSLKFFYEDHLNHNSTTNKFGCPNMQVLWF